MPGLEQLVYSKVELRLYHVGAIAIPSWSYGYTKLELWLYQVGATNIPIGTFSNTRWETTNIMEDHLIYAAIVPQLHLQ